MLGFSLLFIILQVKFNIVMRYYEIKFRLSPDSQDARDILAAILVDAGFESFEDSKEFLTG